MNLPSTLKTALRISLILLAGLLPQIAGALDAEVGHPTFLSPHSAPIVMHGGQVFAVNTPADTVEVIGADALEVVARLIALSGQRCP